MSNILKNALSALRDKIAKEAGLGFRQIDNKASTPHQHKSFNIEILSFDNESDYRESETTVMVLSWTGEISVYYDQSITSIDKYHEISNDIIKIKSALIGAFSDYISQFSWTGSGQILDYQENKELIVVMPFELILRETET